jgi:hypothetical protein
MLWRMIESQQSHPDHGTKNKHEHEHDDDCEHESEHEHESCLAEA